MRGLIGLSSVLIACWVLAPRLVVAEPLAAPDTLRVRSVLGIGSVGTGGRVPFATDTIEARRIRGTFEAPVDGDIVYTAEGDTLSWKTFDADEEGWISDDSLRGGYAFAIVDAPRAGVYLLDGIGYRHVYVNGSPRIGDVYHRKFLRIPVELRAGRNELLFKEGWGTIRAELYAPPAPTFFEERDQTLPSVVVGDPDASLYAGIVVTHAIIDQWSDRLTILARGPSGHETTCRIESIPPSRSRKVAVAFPTPEFPDLQAIPDSVTIELELLRGTEVLDRMEIVLDVVQPFEKHYRSFVSEIDGSVQHYGVTPPPEPVPPDSTVGLILTLHGAGVPATQAHHYQQRDWNYTIAPTNRREFGFDWEDWGRLDALEVLAEVERRFPLHPQNRWLTGHSMGGHGTWNIGAHYPDLFGAIGPSAGWRDFWSYTKAFEVEEVGGIEEILTRSSNASRTLLLERNYLHSGVYVLHGDADDNVPVTQARFMRERLAAFHPNFAYYERPGAGHWWGPNSICMDWPPMIEFLRQNPLPEAREVRNFEFTTINPAISDRCFWASIGQQERSMDPSTISVAVDSSRIAVVTENVSRLDLDLAVLFAGEAGSNVEFDASGIEVMIDEEVLPSPNEEFGTLRFSKVDGQWMHAERPNLFEKGPHRAGPFKDAFRNRMLFVVGTGGSESENRWALSKALFDAETFYYRGNGAVPVVLDVDFDGTQGRDRGVVLYGNAETNAAWDSVLAEDCPIRIHRDHLLVGETRFDGDDLACLFVYPRSGSDVASVAVVSGTGLVGSRSVTQIPYFVSGIGYPDWIVFGADVHEIGHKGVRAAGFFDASWQEAGDSAWK